ncbi:hypothetical protein BLJAPNOD_04850 [Ensifer sp. M14]|uniref:DUF2264 domain-containing protein n=1 Tax=Ensifer sp. M14 TaxID=2203782 RepID=UPI000E1DF4AA|nr:DUF2264 domain-containing protein [Ensifer sp. M14]RDL48573.1 hypothetical protein BLJAPNOD_04850 [Ensifer sp. M14]
MTDGIYLDSLFHPWSGNELRTRADVERALKSLWDPADTYRSAGGARLRFDATAAHFDQAAADLEGFSRLLWGLVPAEVGGADWIDWAPIARGLASGTDPHHAEYWGQPTDRNQRLVELAAIGFALRLVPEKLWAPLEPHERENVVAYLKAGHACRFSENNWKFFRLLIGLGLDSVGADHDRELDQAYIDELETFYFGDGWYSDGDARRADHYIPFAFHFYGLILAVLDGSTYTQPYRERARLAAGDMTRWFADDGAALAFGRSMTYRFAIAGFFGALAFAGEEALPWGQLKGFYLRNLRWWAKQPMASRDGILPVGYAYPNLLMCETYNSPQSPYWALKAFLPLALPQQHPFWSAEEADCPPRDHVAVHRHTGMLIKNPPGDAVALCGGQQTGPQNTWARFGAEKYSKFVYSARYGFSVESDPNRFADAVLDGMLGFSSDGLQFQVRQANEEVLIADDVLYARWRPNDGILVETWLYWHGDFHVRAHRVRTERAVTTKEGGFAIARHDRLAEALESEAGKAVVATPRDLSAIVDLGSSVARIGKAHIAQPNTNLIAAQTLVPQLMAELPPGESTLFAAVLASTDPAAGRSTLTRLPPTPDLPTLEALIRAKGRQVTLMSRSTSA